MTLAPNASLLPTRHVLLACGQRGENATWFARIDVVFRPSGFVLCRTRTGIETVQRVEQGGLAAAVLMEDQRAIDGLSLLRIIRSIDAGLPCWLVTDDTRRHTLQAALALQATSVITHAIEPDELEMVLRRRLFAVPNADN